MQCTLSKFQLRIPTIHNTLKCPLVTSRTHRSGEVPRPGPPLALMRRFEQVSRLPPRKRPAKSARQDLRHAAGSGVVSWLVRRDWPDTPVAPQMVGERTKSSRNVSISTDNLVHPPTGTGETCSIEANGLRRTGMVIGASQLVLRG